MGDPLSITAGLAGVTMFALQSSKALYELIDAIKNNTKTLQQLKEEAQSLLGVLTSLHETLLLPDADFSTLRTPVTRCTKVCDDLSTLVKKCSTHSVDGKFSLRSFLLSTYKGKSIDELRTLLSAYKSTIAIALADANIRQTVITTKLLRDYQRRIENTTSELDELLCKYEEPAGSLSGDGGSNFVPLDAKNSDMETERASIGVCLAICAKVSTHIDQIRTEHGLDRDQSTQEGNRPSVGKTSKAGRITADRLADCQVGIGFTSAELKLHLREMDFRVAKLAQQARSSNDGQAGGEEHHSDSQEDFEAIRKCLSVCQRAADEAASERINVFEDIIVGDDSDQAIVSTFGDLISAKRVRIGTNSSQTLGQLQDETLQHTVQVYAHRRAIISSQPSLRAISGKEKVSDEVFAGKHGMGHKLS